MGWHWLELNLLDHRCHRLRPKLKQTAFALWGLYLFLTFVEFLLLYFTGAMDLFDSINHALTTMPSGGFSTRDASIGFYDSVLVESIIIVFMFLAGVNFTLLWFIRDGDFKRAFGDEEFRNYLVYLTVAIIAIFGALIAIWRHLSEHHYGTACSKSFRLVPVRGTHQQTTWMLLGPWLRI